MSINAFLPSQAPAILVLEDGSIFHGFSIGAAGTALGEVVFNTAMTGYQEILSDPSYAQQIVTLTYPHIGNVGINSEDQESSKAWAAGLIIRALSPVVSNWRATESLQEYLVAQNVVGIAGIDTRALTHLLREKGALRGCIIAGESADESLALAELKNFRGISGEDLASQVSQTVQSQWSANTLALESLKKTVEKKKYRVVAYDFGVKQQILRLLVDRGCEVIVVPAKTTAQAVLAMNPDGIFLSNGPGDPAACDYAIEAITQLLEKKVPLFGICLGFQLMALACGAKTVKMKFGHHGANHPVRCLATNKVFITSQNHSFAVDDQTLPDDLIPTHISLFDGSLQGIAHQTFPAFAFQGHPEASPGPHDIVHLFDQFIEMMKK